MKGSCHTRKEQREGVEKLHTSSEFKLKKKRNMNEHISKNDASHHIIIILFLFTLQLLAEKVRRIIFVEM
jgi:hypothetical protein